MLPGDPGYGVVQSLFDRVPAAIIALAIARSILGMARGRHGRAELRTVIVIGMLAPVRKRVLPEVEAMSGFFLAGLAAAIIALGVTLAPATTLGERAEPPAAPGADEGQGVHAERHALPHRLRKGTTLLAVGEARGHPAGPARPTGSAGAGRVARAAVAVASVPRARATAR